ncbi:uncharacterized protein EI97DRAFT_498983 [Westerdykella ornata]|uniref:Anaphase-promoting complex subunit 5 n=1 Tax=Westerdykella ornata TaxID=318751 RepID=A0A6A6JTI6_WESOR|nr:uncharacterized protein EI97DRAFT_498983 [Westerdykella ornata]KAF2279554.1 hypothetical protein EI97DRAFT_498983 [Westerdykella ornata]
MAMFRYLTVQKVSLLVLVKLYCQSVLPSSATIPILSFILSHTIARVPSSARSHSEASQDASLPIHAFEEVLQSQASSMPGRTLLDVFLKDLWAISSLDALHDLFNSLDSLFERDGPAGESEVHERPEDRIVLHKISPLGTFVRRMRLEFTRLQFDDAMKLWSAFLIYRAPTAQWTRRIAGLASSGVDVNISTFDLGPGDELFQVAYGQLDAEDEVIHAISTHDLERVLEFQLDRLQRLGCRVPDDMRAQLRSLLESTGSVVRQSHLVNFFDAWRAGDYTSAFDNIHRYYDLAMLTRERMEYQYALLHMAILQAEFGSFTEAVAAINETIVTARENQDMTCLNFSLSWLQHLNNACPEQMKRAGYKGLLGSERDAFAFLKMKSRETGMYNLLSATLLNESKRCMATGESVPRAFEQLYQAAHLNTRESIDNHGGHMLLQSTLYSRLGLSDLSRTYCQLLLDCYGHSSPNDERIRARCRCAFNAMHSGRYDDALQLLEASEAFNHRTLKFQQYIYFCTGLIKLKQAIRRADWAACESLFSALDSDSCNDPEISFLLFETRIDYLICHGDFSQAFKLVEQRALALREHDADVLQRLGLLLMKATLFSTVRKPEGGFSVALRAASIAFRTRLMPALWSATGLLANILNTLGDFEAASRMLHAVIPQALENNEPLSCGILYSYLADSYVGLAGCAGPAMSTGNRSRITQMSRAGLYIDKALNCFKEVKDVHGECEQIMKKALLAKFRGDEKLAEEWAQNHNRVWDHTIHNVEQ